MTYVERLVRLFDNPLIVKDGVSRMRSWRAPLVLTLYLGVLGLFGYSVFVALIVISSSDRSGAAQIGGIVFETMAFMQLSLVALFAPALAAGAISGERERQTFDVLLVSRLSALSIVWGKLVASVAFMLLLILAALPLFAAVFLFGGIDFEQFVITQLLTVTTAVSIAAVSLFLSAAFGRTLSSTVAAYGAAFAGMVGTLIVGALLSVGLLGRTAGQTVAVSANIHPLEFANPFYSMWIVLNIPNGAPMPLGRLMQMLAFMPGSPSSLGPMLEPWVATILVQAGLVALSIAGAVQLVQHRRAYVPTRPVEPIPAVERVDAGSEA
ncbi:MAG TPA: ABC transporter permease subunit [Candidatus Dormibacteraeota bacterium]|nr:ABC transporter permease subunit [Candidatus Dormibacteraeota bacterium]